MSRTGAVDDVDAAPSVTSRSRRIVAPTLAALVPAALIVAWIVHRNTGLYPIVLSDEYTYSVGARLSPLDASVIPGHLFLLLYRLTSVCGDGFLACARLLNVAFFVAAAPLVYSVAQRVVPRPYAVAACLLSLAGPFNAYTAYFMPESMYYFGFWLVVWFVLRLEAGGTVRQWGVAGSLVGLLALVKPHALFLLPALTFYGACVASPSGRGGSAVAAGRMGVFVAAAFIVKLGFGWALAGPGGVTLFGSFYGGIASAGGTRWPDVARAALLGVAGHAMALTLLFALPVAMLGARLAQWKRESLAAERSRFCLLTASLVTSLVVVATVFTAAVAGSGPYETTARLHLRYYDFSFPLLWIVATIGVDTAGGGADGPRGLRVVCAATCGVGVLWAAVVGFAQFEPNVVDSPDIFAMAFHPTTRRVAAAFALATLALWVVRPRLATVAFVAAVVPWTAWKSGQQITDQFVPRRTADLYDRAGLLARANRAHDEGGAVRVLGDDASGVYRAMFQIDDARSSWTLLAPHEPVTAAAWPVDARWALIVGDHPVAVPHVTAAIGEGIVLVRRSDAPGPTQ